MCPDGSSSQGRDCKGDPVPRTRVLNYQTLFNLSRKTEKDRDRTRETTGKETRHTERDRQKHRNVETENQLLDPQIHKNNSNLKSMFKDI